MPMHPIDRLRQVLHERADEAQDKLEVEALCGFMGNSPPRLIDSAFKRWHLRLCEAARYDIPRDMRIDSWWNESLGKYGKKVLTRRLLAERVRVNPNIWELTI